MLPQLRLLVLHELLCAPAPARCCDLCGVVYALCGALSECVRRRAGWLYAQLPENTPLPVTVSSALVQAAVLQALRQVLTAGDQAVLSLSVCRSSAVLCMRSARPLPCSLWHRLAQQGGGFAVSGSGAAVRLPFFRGAAVQRTPTAQELLEDRFSLPYLFLSGYCAEPW